MSKKVPKILIYWLSIVMVLSLSANAVMGVLLFKNMDGGSAKQVNVEDIFPAEGYTLDVSYGDIGPKMIEAGVIDLEKFKTVYENSGKPLTDEQLKILTEGSDEKIMVNKDNSYFLLNFFWAFGLGNSNEILDSGPLAEYEEDLGNFASTGGWSLAKSDPMDYYSKTKMAVLNEDQQKTLDEVTYNVYRPCCNNSTAFADCNHGMAALGLAELMAASGSSTEEMFEALKYFNSYWFPQQYVDLALYFKIRDGLDWDEIDAKTLLSADYSSADGWGKVRSWLQSQNATQDLSSSGGSCGV